MKRTQKELLDAIDEALTMEARPNYLLRLLEQAAEEIRRLNTVETNVRANNDRLREQLKQCLTSS